MLRLPDPLRAFAALLEAHQVEYLIVGGYAVAYHGYPRFTGDIDFFIAVAPENAKRLQAVLEEFGFGNVGLSEADFLDYGAVIQLGYAPNRIDILTQVDGVTFAEAWPLRQVALVDGLPLKFIDRESLIASKRAAGRPKDQADLVRLTRPRKKPRSS